jgi:hypothetical protein
MVVLGGVELEFSLSGWGEVFGSSLGCRGGGGRESTTLRRRERA